MSPPSTGNTLRDLDINGPSVDSVPDLSANALLDLNDGLSMTSAPEVSANAQRDLNNDGPSVDSAPEVGANAQRDLDNDGPSVDPAPEVGASALLDLDNDGPSMDSAPEILSVHCSGSVSSQFKHISYHSINYYIIFYVDHFPGLQRLRRLYHFEDLE